MPSLAEVEAVRPPPAPKYAMNECVAISATDFRVVEGISINIGCQYNDWVVQYWLSGDLDLIEEKYILGVAVVGEKR